MTENDTEKLADKIRRLEQALYRQKNNEKEFWYIEFEQYIRDNFFAPAPYDPFPLIRWHDLDQSWYVYKDEGYYQKVFEPTIKQIFYNWADQTDINCQGKERTALSRLKSMVHFQPFWDTGAFEDRRVENVRNGLLDLDTKELFPHTPEYFSKTQVPRVFDKKCTEIPAPLAKIYSATPDWEYLHRFLVSLVHRRYDNEGALFLYGPKGAGKTTAGTLIQAMYGPELLSNTSLFRLGSSFGLENVFDKRINVNLDLARKKLNADTVATFKLLVGREFRIEVNRKGLPKFSYPINCFFIYSCNQLMTFAKEATQEIGSIMRRLALVKFPTTQVKDPAFKAQMEDPDLLDEVFSYLANQPYQPLCDPIEADDYINEVTRRWLMDSDPVMRIVNELYELDEEMLFCSPDGDPVYNSILCHEVMEKVNEVMMEEELLPPGDLQADVTEALKALKIYSDGKRGRKRSYLKIKLRGHP